MAASILIPQKQGLRIVETTYLLKSLIGLHAQQNTVHLPARMWAVFSWARRTRSPHSGILPNLEPGGRPPEPRCQNVALQKRARLQGQGETRRTGTRNENSESNLSSGISLTTKVKVAVFGFVFAPTTGGLMDIEALPKGTCGRSRSGPKVKEQRQRRRH